MIDWNARFKKAAAAYRAELKAVRATADFGADFGANYNGNSGVLTQVQAKLNALGMASPSLATDGRIGPLTIAAIKKFQTSKGLSPDGVVGDQTLAALGIANPAEAPTNPQGTTVAPAVPQSSDPIRRPTRAVAIATMAKALRQAASDLGHPLNDNLLAMMLGQKLGAEGAMPGLWDGKGYTFAGTNNSGAAQVPGGSAGVAWAAARKLIQGWGAFAHMDSNPPGPVGGPYIGWYFIAPTVYDAAKQWLTGYGGTKNVLARNPSTPEEYAGIMYDSGYFTGLSHDRAKEVAAYANNVRRGMPSLATINGPANDPTLPSVDPSLFRSVTDRHLTESLFNLAKTGKQGSAWAFLLPATWDDFVRQNGVVWFGPPVEAAMRMGGAASLEAVKKVGVIPWLFGIVGFVLGLKWLLGQKKPPQLNK